MYYMKKRSKVQMMSNVSKCYTKYRMFGLVGKPTLRVIY